MLSEMETEHQNRCYFPEDIHHSSRHKQSLKDNVVSKTGPKNCKMMLKNVTLVEMGIIHTSPGFLWDVW